MPIVGKVNTRTRDVLRVNKRELAVTSTLPSSTTDKRNYGKPHRQQNVQSEDVVIIAWVKSRMSAVWLDYWISHQN